MSRPASGARWEKAWPSPFEARRECGEARQARRGVLGQADVPGMPPAVPGGRATATGRGAQGEITLATHKGLNLETLYFKEHRRPNARAAS